MIQKQSQLGGQRRQNSQHPDDESGTEASASLVNHLNGKDNQLKTAEFKAKADSDYEVWDNWANKLILQATPQIEYGLNSKPQEHKINQESLESAGYDSAQIKPELLEQIVEVEQKQIEVDSALILETLKSKAEFPATGSLEAKDFNELHSPIPEAKSYLGEESALPIEHQEVENVNLQNPTMHHNDIDFKYFFDTTSGFTKEGIKAALKFVLKHTLNAKNWSEAKSALWDNLLIKDIFGFGQKKAETPEEKAQEEKNKKIASAQRVFYDSLSAGLRSLASSEQRRALRLKIESINKTLKRGNLSYEGILDQKGQIREDVLIDSEKANSQQTEEKLKTEKKKKLAMAIKPAPKRGPGITFTMDKAHNFNNAAKLAG